ncbi:RidA family protein [Rhizobium giardinii]|uniref:Enamine deaminase RidA (YjgF/YER057c/UK114 family) n=1 Tax=Rhizobium giardinii TaxID=56731 RepID=A0A7W8UGA3_9HYPH|nr:RidA family protein [Rhizobium giardinii]MBB5538856.1 enamine deaminase RidA (YjgF/YER057c/UK114 family) [Rhizobium giardinii]
MLQTPEQRISSLNLALPKISKPAGNLLGFKVDRGLVYVSGQLPLEDGVVKYTGRAGDAVSQEMAYEAAKLAALNVISQLSLATDGNLSRIQELVKVSGFVACTPEFTNIPAVVNGASDLFVEVFGESGAHARFAVGVAALPRGVPVEVEVIARLRD